MQLQKYLKEKQPVLYQTFVNALNNNKLAHAYLIIGESGTPLKQVAIYLAKSLLCDKRDPLACNECPTCLRVDNDEYADIIIIDGEEGQISKSSVDHITDTFSKTANEIKGKVIYILHLVENSDSRATNALLKFLEEPGPNTYAFLTTQNEARVLPTIVSRCQRLSLRLTPRNEVISNAISEGIYKEDAELLSYFYNDNEQIKEKMSDDQYLAIKEVILKLIEKILDKEEAMFIVDYDLAKVVDDKISARLALDILASFIEDSIRYKEGEKIFLSTYDKIIKELAERVNHLDKVLLEIMNLRSKINLNINLISIFEHLFYYISEVEK